MTNEDDDCDTSEEPYICPRIFMGILSKSEDKYYLGFFSTAFCAFTIFFCLSLILKGMLQKMTYPRIRYRFFVMFAKCGCGKCAISFLKFRFKPPELAASTFNDERLK